MMLQIKPVYEAEPNGEAVARAARERSEQERETTGDATRKCLNPRTLYEPQTSQGSERLAAEWVAFRRCAGTDPNVFFPNDGAGVIVAQQVCAQCPVKDPCRDYALANNITHGVWGGTSERQRRRILRDRRSAGKAARAA